MDEQQLCPQRPPRYQLQQRGVIWTPSSVRRNCDFCVKKKVKCPGSLDGTGCVYCKKKGVKCEYSVKKKPGPKCRKREGEGLGEESVHTRQLAPAMEVTEGLRSQSPSPRHKDAAPNNSATPATPQRRQQHSFATGVAGSSGSFAADDGDDFDGSGGGGIGRESGSFPMANSPSSRHFLTPSKKPKATHDRGSRSARQRAKGEPKRKNVPLRPKHVPPTQWRWGPGEDDSRPASSTCGEKAQETLQGPVFHRAYSDTVLPVSSAFNAGGSAGGGGGTADDGNHGCSLHSGGGPPITPPSFHGLSPPSSTLAAGGAPGDDLRVGARLDGSAGSYGVRRASSGGHQLLQSAIQAGGNLDGAGGGRAGPVDSHDASSNGGSFVFGLKCEEPNLAKVFGLLDPLSATIDREISEGSDAFSNNSDADDDEMARIEAISIDRKPAAGDLGRRRIKQETMPAVGVGEEAGTRQSNSLGGSAASGSGGGGGDGFSLDDAEVVLAFGESFPTGMTDAGSFGSELDVRRQQVMRHLREDSQMQLQQLQQQRPLPLDSPCSPHHQALGHHSHRRRVSKPESSVNQSNHEGTVGSPPPPSPPPPSPPQQQQQQQHDQPPVPQLHGFDVDWLARAEAPGGSSRFVADGGGVNRIPCSLTSVSEPGSGAGECSRGGGAIGPHPGDIPLTAAIPLDGDARMDIASEMGADRESIGIGFASNTGPSAQHLDGRGSEGLPSPFDPFAHDFGQGQHAHARRYSYGLGDWSGTDAIIDEYLDFLGLDEDGPPVSDIDMDTDHHAL